MANWCVNRLVLTGPTFELDRVRKLLQAAPVAYRRNLRLAAAIPEGIERPRTPGPVPLVFHTMLPPPPDLTPQKATAWQLSAWGTKWEPEGDTTWDVTPALNYTFDTAWTVPDRWARILAETFPVLGIALHGIEPGSGIYVSHLYRGGRHIRDIDYSQDAASRKEFSSTIFDWIPDPDDDLDQDPEAQSGPRVDVVYEAAPIEGVAEDDLQSLQAASSEGDIKKVELGWRELGVPENVRLSLLADYAAVLSPSLLGQILRHNGPTRRLILREKWPTGVCTTLLEWAHDLLASLTPEEPRPTTTTRSFLSASLPEELHSLLDVIEEGILQRECPPELLARKRLEERVILARVALERVARDGGVSWNDHKVQEIATFLEKEVDAAARAAAPFLALLQDTPEIVLEKIANRLDVGETELADRLIVHPNATVQFRIRLLELGVSPSAMLLLLDDPQSRRSPDLRRALRAVTDVHPAVLAELARDAEPDELQAILAQIMSLDIGPDRVRYTLHALEHSPEESPTRVSPEIWTQLFQDSDPRIRERSLLALRDKSKERSRRPKR